MININVSRKHLIFLVLIVAIATVVNYTIAQGGTQSHPASEVAAGSFATGTYTFPGTVNVNTRLVAAEVCIPDAESCETSWPSGGGQAFSITTETYTTDNCNALCNPLTCAFGVGGNKLEGCSETFGSSRVVRCACWP